MASNSTSGCVKQPQKLQSAGFEDLEFSLAFDLGSMLNLEGKGVEDTYIGIGVSHRSGIFGTFNNVDGGSNFLMFFIEKEI